MPASAPDHPHTLTIAQYIKSHPRSAAPGVAVLPSDDHGRTAALAAADFVPADVADELRREYREMMEAHAALDIPSALRVAAAALAPIGVVGIQPSVFREYQHVPPPPVVSVVKKSTGIDMLWLKQFVAGGIAGGVSRTVTSPLERTKILFQIQSSAAAPNSYSGVFATLGRIWREEGWRGYMRGNGTNVIRIVPYSAVQFAAYEKYKRMLMEEGKTELNSVRRLSAGAMAGITSVACTYPLDIVRTRLSVQSASALRTSGVLPELPGIMGTMTSMFRNEGGIRALYRGLGATLTGVAPYVALNFQSYEVLRKYFTKPGDSSPTHTSKLVCGALAGTIAQTCTYPLDVLRRRMQVTGMSQMAFKYSSTWQAVREMIRNEGVRSLYKGMIPNYLKVAPSIGVSFWTYEFCKSAFGC